MFRVYSDGGSRGNPGPSAIAFIVLNEEDRILKKGRRFLGEATCNQAEYRALILALEQTLEFGSGSVKCFLDSELIVKQLNGQYKAKNPELKALLFKVRELQGRFRNVSFSHVSREDEYIRQVDSMVNEELDESLDD